MSKVDGYNSYSLVQAKEVYMQGHTTHLRVDYVLGSSYLFLCSKWYQRPIRTQRYQQKEYKTLNAIIRDYEYITGKPFNSFNIDLTVSPG